MNIYIYIYRALGGLRLGKERQGRERKGKERKGKERKEWRGADREVKE